MSSPSDNGSWNQPSDDPYGPSSSSDPYSSPSASDPYGQPAQGQSSASEPWGPPQQAAGGGYQQPYGAPGAAPGGAPVPAGAAPGGAPVPAGAPAGQSRLVVGLLGIFLGGWGVHRFLMGYTTIGIIQIAVTLVTCGIGSIWGLIEGIMVLAKAGSFTHDAHGRPLTD